MSRYEDVEDRLSDFKCSKCHGSGEYDDAEPGDISFNTYKCTECSGSGFSKNVTCELRVTIGEKL